MLKLVMKKITKLKDAKEKTLISFILIISLLFLFYIFLNNKKIRAEIIYFYPQSCLGSFINPEKAQGEPEIDNQSLINETNSA